MSICTDKELIYNSTDKVFVEYNVEFPNKLKLKYEFSLVRLKFFPI